MNLNPVAGVVDAFSGLVGSVGKAIDDNTTNEEEKLILRNEVLKIIMDFQEKVNNGQIEINKIEAASESFFKSGWRPAIAWICVAGMMFQFVFIPGLSLFGIHIQYAQSGDLFALAMSLLGLAGVRSFDKLKGLNK